MHKVCWLACSCAVVFWGVAICSYIHSLLTLGAHARGLLQLSCVCVCVFVSVAALVASASIHSYNQRYVLFSLRLFLDFTRGFSKNASVRKLWREKANMLMSFSSPWTAFTHFRDQRSTSTTWWITGEPSVASEACYRGRKPVRGEKIDWHWTVARAARGDSYRCEHAQYARN